jgi:hypothetical protein
MSPSGRHSTARWLGRVRSRSSVPTRAPTELSYAEQMRVQALQEYQRRLAEPLILNNEEGL